MENNNLRSNSGIPVGANTPAPAPAATTPLFADVTRSGVPATAPQLPPAPAAVQNAPTPAAPPAPNPAVAPLPAAPTPTTPKPPRNWRKILIRLGVLLLILSLLGAGILLFDALRNRSSQQTVNNVNLVNTSIPLNEFATSGSLALLGAQSLAVNGQLRANESFILAPQAQPARTERGQLYYDQNTNALAYYNGSTFVELAGSSNTVQTFQGQSGNVTLVAGAGITVTGTTLTNSGVTSLGGQTGAIGLGVGLTLSGGNLQATGIQTVTSGSPGNLSVTTDASGNVTITSTGAGTGTVQSPGGTAGRIAMFTGAQTIEDSVISQSGTTVTVTGDLAVATGGLTLANALTVANGGTGATTLAANGVIVGNGTSALSSVTAGGAGLCLLSTAGAPSFQACPGGASVTSVNGLTGALTIANASGAGSTITIDDASTSQKGIAQFNATNFSASGGVVNTIQDISTSASPTFAGMTLTGDLAVNGGDITSTGALALTASSGNITLNSTGTIELQDATNITGNLTATGNGDFQGGSVTVGTTSQGGTVVLYDGSSNTGSISVASLSANRTYTLPDASGTICLSTGNCAGAGVTLQTAYNNSSDPEITVDATRGALTVRDNATPIGANLLEVQNNAGGTTYFGVSASGVAVTGSATVSSNINSSGGAIQTNGTSRIDNSGNLVNIGNLTLSGAISGGTTYSGSGNINTSGGGLQTGGTTRVDNSGNLTNIGNLTLSGAISGGTTYTGSGNINTTGGSLQTAGTTRVDNSGNLTNIGNITGSGAITIASTGAGNDIIIDGADQFIVQDAANFNALATFNSDVDMTFAGSENLSITSTVTGTTTVNLIGAVLTNNTTSGTQQVALLQNAAGSGSTEGLLVLDNADTDTAVTSGLQITSAAGGITNAIDVSDADITTALLFGANDITGTNFSVAGGTGSITSAGNATLQGGTVTVGTASQAGSLVVHDGSSNTGTIQIAALGQDTVYTLPDPGGGTATICLTTGNCAGTGGGITGSGTTNRLSKFTGAGTIGNSTISDDGTNVTTTVDVVVQGGDLTVGGTSQLASLLLHDGNGQTTTLRAGDSSGNLTFILPTAAGSANQCLKQSGVGNQLTWQDCDGGGGGSSATLQTAYNNGNGITTTDGRDIDIVLANTTTDSNFDLVVADGSTSFVSFTRADGAGTADPAQMLLVDNLDTNRALPIGIKLQAAGGGMTTAIDASDAEIVDAISVGANNIVGTTGNIDMTNFDVAGASGNITTAGDLAVNGGDITSTGALTITTSGGNISLASSGTIELQSDTNVTGNADVSGTLAVGTGNAFQVTAGGDVTTAGDGTLQGGSLTLGGTAQAGNLTISDGSSNTGNLLTAALSADRTYTLPNETGTVCLQNSTSCGFALTGTGDFIQNQSAVDQTADFRISGTGRANTAIVTPALRPLTNGTTALQIQNAAGSSTALVVDTTNLRVGIGAGSAPTEALDVTGNLVVKDAGNTKSYRFRTSGGELDFESSGAALTVSTWSGAGFTGTQRTYLVLEEGSHTAQALGAWQFRTADGLTVRHSINGTATADVGFNQNGEATNFTVQGDTDANLFLVQGSTDRVGIGTASPNFKLDVNGTLGVTGNTTLSGDLAANGNTTIGDANTDTLTVTAILQGASPLVFEGGTADLNELTLSIATLNADRTITLPDATGTVCLQSSTSCGFVVGSGTAFLQGGNTLGTTATFGTNDNFGINIRVNTNTVATFGTNGSLQLRNSANSTTALDLENAAGDNVFTINTTNSRVGINLGANNTPTLNGSGLEVQGGLRLSGGGSGSLTDQYTTPLGSGINAKLNIPNYDPGNGSNTIIAAGMPTTASSLTSTVISVFDPRSNSNHWPSIAVWSPDESKLLGLTWAGDNTEGRVTTHNATGTTGGIALQSGDTAGTGTASGGVAVRSGNGVGSNNSTGSVTIDSGSATGTGTAGNINIGTTNAPLVVIGNTSSTTRVVTELNVRGPGTDSQNGMVTFGAPAAWTPTIKGINDASVSWFGGGFGEDILSLEVAGLQFGTGTGDPSYTLDAFNGRHTFAAQSNFGYLRFLDDADNEIVYADETQATFRTISASTSSFRVLNSSTVPMFQIDTTNNRIYMGNTSADSDGVVTILDTKNTSGDPTSTGNVNGAMYYNSNAGKFRCYENSNWKNCLGFNTSLTMFGMNGKGSGAEWTNMPAALTEFFVGAGVTNPSSRMRFDLTQAEQIRLQVNVDVVGATNAEIRIQYSTDQTTWNYLDSGNTGLGQNVSTSGLKVSSWSNIAAGAKGDVYLRLVGINGDATADPTFGLIQVQAR